jgi:hypothetical protein
VLAFVYHARKAVVLELPELEQRLSNLQNQVERLWRKAEASVPPIEQRLASMAEQYAEHLKRWAVTVERHTHAVAQLEAYASEWRDASSQMRQETADRLHELESTIEREWDALKRMQEEPIRELREQAESLTQVSVAMANASQQGLDRAEARFVSFEREVHLRLNELTIELQSALAEIRARLDRTPAPRDASSQWSLDDVTRLHGQLREGARGVEEFPNTIDHPPAGPSRQLLTAREDAGDAWRALREKASQPAAAERAGGIPPKWVAAVVLLAVGVVTAAIFGWRIQSQIKAANERLQVSDLKVQTLLQDAARQNDEIRQEARKERDIAREMANRAQRVAEVLAAGDLIRFPLSGADGASGQALFSRSRGLVVSGSRLPTASGVLQGWLLTRTAAVNVGPLDVQPDGTATLVQPVPAIPRAVVGVMVTDEATSGGEVPSGPAVLTSVRTAQAAAADDSQP